MPAKLRKSSAKLPITKSEKAKTAESSGEENDENKAESRRMTENPRKMKKKPTRRRSSALRNLSDKKNNAPNTPTPMKNVFTTSAPASPKNLPTMNSHLRTGRESTV